MDSLLVATFPRAPRRIAQFERTLKIRPIIIRWRSQWTNKPRTADFSIQVLSRILSYATDTLGKLSGNPCEGISDRR